MSDLADRIADALQATNPTRLVMLLMGEREREIIRSVIAAEVVEPALPEWLQAIVDANDELLLTHEGFLWGKPLWACMSGDCSCAFVYVEDQYLDRYSFVGPLMNDQLVWCPNGQNGCPCHDLPRERPGADEED